MMKAQTHIHLGFEVGTGEPVSIPLGHLTVTGQTQQAGKTTALEGLISRSGLCAVTFITKRGEGSFTGGHRLAPFFRERADWVFVASLIDATLGEKNKLLRSWLMKVCRGTRTLAEVQCNVKEAHAKARGFSESIYTEIDGYLDLVVPQLAQLPPVREVVIRPGLNVMDLSPYSPELQGLVIRSVLDHVYQHEENVVTVIPEAWEFLPERRGSPVKLAAENLIRKGAGLKNYMWIDSQDLAGVWKTVVRACPVYLVGVQREANEIRRTLDNIPAGTAKPKAADVAMLELGQFYACWGRNVVKTYVQPAWLEADQASAVAWGKVRAEDYEYRKPKPVERKDEKQEMSTTNNDAPSYAWVDTLQWLAVAVENLVAELKQARSIPTVEGSPVSISYPVEFDTDEIVRQVLEGLPSSTAAGSLSVSAGVPEIEVRKKRHTVKMDDSTLRGRIAVLIAGGFFKGEKTAGAVCEHLATRGHSHDLRTARGVLDDLTAMGFFTLRVGGNQAKYYKSVESMKVNIIEE